MTKKTKQVWRKGDVSIRQKGEHFFVGRSLSPKLEDWRPPQMVFGPLPTRPAALDFAKDYFFGNRAAKRRNCERAKIIIEKFGLKQFDWAHMRNNYLCVLTTAARMEQL